MSHVIGDTSAAGDARACRRLVWSSPPCSSHQSPSEVAARYGVHRSWVYKLQARYEAEGDSAFEPRSRRPKTSPTAISDHTVDLIIGLRKQLSEVGLDAGPDAICWHLQQHHQIAVSAATVSRHLAKAGLVIPEPKKRPKSYIHFQAAMPNETWQSDFTHYPLADGTDVEILTWLDDCTRMAIRVTAHHRVTTPIVLAEFRKAVKTAGIPASTLTDNGMVFTVRLAGVGRQGGRNAFEHELRRLHIIQKNGRPNRHARTHVILLIQDLDVRIVNAVTGELLRELTINPNRDYQPRN